MKKIPPFVTLVVGLSGFLFSCQKADQESETLESSQGRNRCSEKADYLAAARQSEQYIVCAFGSPLLNTEGVPNICAPFGRLNAGLIVPTAASVPLAFAAMAERVTNPKIANSLKFLGPRITKLVGPGAPLVGLATFVPSQIARAHTAWADMDLASCNEGENFDTRERWLSNECSIMVIKIRNWTAAATQNIANGNKARLGREWLKQHCARQFTTDLNSAPNGRENNSSVVE